MADTLPTPEIARLDVPLARFDADLQFLRLKREADARFLAGRLAEQRHQYYDLDADSAFTVPGACCRSYLTAGGQP